MKAGTIIKLPDGRFGTVVYHGLDGYGIKWGKHHVPVDELVSGLIQDVPDNYQWEPDAMLRDDYPTDLECVGNDFEIFLVPEDE